MTPIFNVKTGTVSLFEGQNNLGTFQMRGAVTLPCRLQQGGGPAPMPKGVILVAGRNVDTDLVEVFLEREFLTVEPILDQATGRMESPGALSIYMEGWARWFCREYYIHQPDMAEHMHRVELSRIAHLNPKPHLIHVPFGEAREADAALWDRSQRCTLAIPKGGLLAREIARYLAKPDEPTPPAWAAMVLCAGAAMFPPPRKTGK